jgi:hypothetical protein
VERLLAHSLGGRNTYLRCLAQQAFLITASFYILERPLTSFAMPSGHTLTAFAVLSGIYFAIDRKHRGPFFWLFVVAAFGGFARIALGAHWPSDVFAGAALGIFGGIIGGHFSNRMPDALFQRTSWLLRLIGFGAALCAYMLLTTKIDFKLAQPIAVHFRDHCNRKCSDLFLAKLSLRQKSQLTNNYF